MFVCLFWRLDSRVVSGPNFDAGGYGFDLCDGQILYDEWTFYLILGWLYLFKISLIYYRYIFVCL